MIDIEDLAGLIFFGSILGGDIAGGYWCWANGWILWFVLAHVGLVGIAVNSEMSFSTPPNQD